MMRILSILLLAVIGAGAGHYASGGFDFGSKNAGAEEVARGIAACAKESNAIECARDVIARVGSFDAGHVMDTLAETLTPVQCHYMGHVVGQEAYRAYQSVERAVSECGRSCQGACVHGALGEAFTEAIGNEDVDPANLSFDELRSVGRKLCSNGSTCHGVGHALFQLTEDFEPALQVCSDIASDELKVYCYRGVFMEYADARASRSALTDAPAKPLSIRDLDALCTNGAEDTRRACFIYLPKLFEVAMREEGKSEADALTHVRSLCASFDTNDRLSCSAGIGAYWSYHMFTMPDKVRSECALFKQTDETIACIIGVMMTATEHRERQNETAAFCSSLDDAIARPCFEYMFAAYDAMELRADIELCGSDTRCREAFESGR